MYEDTRKERLRRMQQIVSRPRPDQPNNGTPRPQSMLLIGFVVFALAGLLMGFTFGALNQPKQVAQNNGGGNIGSKPTATPTKAPTATPTPQDVPQGAPIPGNYQNPQQADGQTVYTFSMQVTNQNPAGKGLSGTPANIAGFTCKMWLIHLIPDPTHNYYNIPYDRVKNVSAVQASITGQYVDKQTNQVKDDNVQEVTGLDFDTTTKQAQNCNNTGQANWKYTIPQSFPMGDYLLVYLSWGFNHDNWGWRPITIQKAG